MTSGLRFATAAAVLLAGAAPLTAQRPSGGDRAHEQLVSELSRIREAATMEAAGNLEGAERVVREVLRANPASLTALLTYERLLNVQGRLRDVLPVVDRLIELEPVSVIGHQVRLRAYAHLDDAAGIEATVNRWIQATPRIETPYREAAMVWRQRNESKKDIAVLELGRKRIDRPDALALELGDAHAAAGDFQRAAAEWARAVGPEGRGFLLVQRRVHNQPDGGAHALPLLVDQLSAAPVTPGRQRAAALLAIDAGLEPRAQRIAQALAAGGPAEDREQLLVELGRRADAAGLYRLAAWSYAELLRGTRDTGATLAIRTRLAELALLAGDTALAADVYRRLESAAAPGSPQRRQAMALRLQLTIREGDLQRAGAELEAFRTEYPHAPELDETAALLALRHLHDGAVSEAERLLQGVSGEHSARIRGRLLIRRGELAAAREELLAAAPLLQGRAATETIALAALLTRLSAQGGELVAHAIAASDLDRERITASAVEDTRRLPATERAAVLDFMAAMAEADGRAEDADAMRHEIVTALPRTHEAAGALLALARSASRTENAEQATVLLEKLILEYPRSALAPQARRELERLHGRRSTP